jgi:hypothetical protein
VQTDESLLPSRGRPPFLEDRKSDQDHDPERVVVIPRTRLLGCISALVSGLSACGPSAPSPPIDAPISASAAASSREVPLLVADSGAPAQAAAREARTEIAAPAYSKAGILPLDPACKDPRAVLGTAAFDDPILIARIRRAMAAHPELEVTTGPPSGPGQLTLSRAGYGTKSFSLSTPEKNTFAVIARCADAATCLDVAAMIRAVVPGCKPVLTCGQPPAVSGGVIELHGPWTAPAARTEDRLPAPPLP